MKFYKLANGYIEEEGKIKTAFLITTGHSPDKDQALYQRFVSDLCADGLAQEVSPTVGDLLRSGNKVYATALYREESGCTLLEARKHIEEMEEGRPA